MTEVIVSYSILGALLVMMALGVVFSVFMPVTDLWSKRFFVTLFSLLLACSIACFLAMIFYDDPDMAAVERVVYFFEALLLSLLIALPTLFILHSCGENIKTSPLFRASATLWCV